MGGGGGERTFLDARFDVIVDELYQGSPSEERPGTVERLRQGDRLH